MASVINGVCIDPLCSYSIEFAREKERLRGSDFSSWDEEQRRFTLFYSVLLVALIVYMAGLQIADVGILASNWISMILTGVSLIWAIGVNLVRPAGQRARPLLVSMVLLSAGLLINLGGFLAWVVR
jgi:hypothetical protein